MLSDAELQTIKARAEAATEGPWTVGNDVAEGVIYGHTWAVAEARLYPDNWANHPTQEGYLPAVPGEHIDSDANAAFIAHARQDIPALLAEVDRLRAYEQASRPVIDAVALSMEIVKSDFFDGPVYRLMSPRHESDRQWLEQLIIQARAARSGE